MIKTITSKRWSLLSVEKQKLVKSFGYGLLALVALVLANYLEQFGLPSQVSFLAPFIPTIVNFLTKWAGENTYTK